MCITYLPGHPIHHPEKVKKLAITGANLRPDSTAVPQALLDLIAPAYNGLKNKKDRNAEENAGYKLVRMIMEQPHIPDADL